jgi:L-lactate dehydrogenase complex protein LldF
MQHGIDTENFIENYRRALLNEQLQRALSNATARFTIGRRLAIAGVGQEWEELRQRAREIKQHAVNNLDYYLDQFTSNVERLGGRVFWARDAAEANRYISDLARARGASLAVKSKSMMTEEIELNHALAAAGVEAIETDLGEYIIQLADERPSHIIAPAIHKSRGDVADLFTEKLGVERNDEIERMTAIARRVLRERFLRADMGVTGANFAIAETGTIVLVENEGNIRLTTSLPRLHVVLMGIEKVIPRMEDLAVFLRLLPRSASGQQMSAYVSFLTGVKQSPDEEGPAELRIVILDNGRTRMLADEQLRESLYCIRCGACLNVCPVYQKIGGHAYGWIYPGPIGSVITPQLVGHDRAANLPFASSLCGACRDACPVKINLPDMLLKLRHEIKEPVASQKEQTSRDQNQSAQRSSVNFKKRASKLMERVAFKLWAATMKNPSRYKKAMRFARLAEQAFGDNLPVVSRWTARRELPRLAARSFREEWQLKTARKEKRND